MPAFLTLTVADIERSVDWYVNGLDFIVLFTLPGPEGRPSLVHLRRWRYQDILVRTGVPPAGGDWTFSIMAEADQLDQLAERAQAHGGGTVEGPDDTPWNTGTCAPRTRTGTPWCTQRGGARANGTKPSAQ